MRIRGIGQLCPDSFLAYVQRFDIIPQPGISARGNDRTVQPDPSSRMYAFKRSIRSDGNRLGDVIPLTRIRTPVQLVPRFGREADSRLTMETSLEYSTEFWLNKYETKDMFWALYTS